MKQILIKIDIDGVLTHEHKGWDYANRKPDMKNIENLRKLYATGEYHVAIFTSRRREEDREITNEWLNKYHVPRDELIMDKPYYEVFIEDKALPFLEPNLHELLNYDIGGLCWRFKEGKIQEGEKHPCFFCGKDIEIEIGDCKGCGIVTCPSCSKCLCNIPILTYLTVIKVHKKYCCNLPDFIGNIELEGAVDMTVVKHSIKTLFNCAKREGLIE